MSDTDPEWSRRRGAIQGEPVWLSDPAVRDSEISDTAEAMAPAKPARRRSGLAGRLIFLALVMALLIGGYSLMGRALPLPVWLVAEVESRLNAAIANQLPQGAVALGAVALTVERNGVPRLQLDDVRLLKADGSALLTLPEVRLALDGASLLSGSAKVSSLRITGAHLAVTRDEAGNFDFALGAGASSAQIKTLADLFEVANRSLNAPGLDRLTRIEADALTVSLTDQRIGRSFELGDGRVTLDNRSSGLGVELAVSLPGQGAVPGRALVQLVSEKGASEVRLSAEFNDISAADIAVQSALLSPLSNLDAPISGRLSSTLGKAGITVLEATLDIGKGALQPTTAAVPVVFDRASLAMAYDAVKGQVNLSKLVVESPTLRAKAKGKALLVDKTGAAMTGPLTGALPAAFLTQIAFEEVFIDPEGVFAEPVRFSSGALDARLAMQPFLVEIGQLSLAEDQRRLVIKGRIGADAAGWTAALDLDLNQIAHDRLIALWPKTLLAKTRDWLGKNLLKGTLTDVHAALRVAPGADPRLHLNYDFEAADVRFMPSLPPVQNGKGYSTVEGRTYTMVLTSGTVTAPQGGQIDMAGSVFAVPDVTVIPARAEIRLATQSSLTAALSLLNLPPFQFMTKADRPVDLGEGVARINTRLTLPLQKKIAFGDVDYQVSGKVTDFRSNILVPGRVISAKSLDVSADPKGLAIFGAGLLGEVPFEVTFRQGFGPDNKGRSRIEGEIDLSQAVAEEFGLGLPGGMVSGKGKAKVDIALQKGAPGQLTLTSDLAGIGLTIPEVGWTKPAKSPGNLTAEVTLGAVPKVDRLSLEAADLKAEGQVTMRQGGGLDTARFDRVTMGEWLDSTVILTGRGSGKAVGIALQGGAVDLRYIPGAEARKSSQSGQGSGPLSLNIDRLIVTTDIALTDFRGDFSLIGGFSGDFQARLNGEPAVAGTAVPSKHGTAVRLRSDDAGSAMASAGIFASARGGRMDLTLTPRETEGHYDGRIAIRDIRVRNASVLAELLNAVSVVGLLEQLRGQGLVFNEVDGEFLLTPKSVDLRRGSATGASLGVSMAGVYQSGSRRLAMQGVISPVYLLNGVGAILTKRGEGVFGFNYSLEGTSDAPDVSVNPLSIFTPGMLREMLRGNRGNGRKLPSNTGDN